MAKLTHEQFEEIAQCSIDAKRDSLAFMQAIESAARREAFKEAAEVCSKEASTWKDEEAAHKAGSLYWDWAVSSIATALDCMNQIKAIDAPAAPVPENILALAEKEGQ